MKDDGLASREGEHFSRGKIRVLFGPFMEEGLSRPVINGNGRDTQGNIMVNSGFGELVFMRRSNFGGTRSSTHSQCERNR